MSRYVRCSDSGISIGISAVLALSIMLAPTAATARVVRVEVNSREIAAATEELIPAGPYEVIKGVIYLEVDPNDPANRQIVDLKLAKTNNRGNVEFSTDFELHKPVDANRGNHRLVYFVNNRGNKLGTWHFNYQAGKSWLYSRGYSYLWCGWNCDVIVDEGRLNIDVPIATDNGKTITGQIYAEMISYANVIVYSRPIVWGGSISYPPLNMDKSDASLSMRQYRHEEAVEIPVDGWEFARFENGEIIPDSSSIYIKDGFRPGWLYDLVYIGKNPKVTGLGMAAIRDVVSYFRYERADEAGNENPLAGAIRYAFAWGHSQSGRLLNHFVYQNFNGDEMKRMVFDGIMANCPGGGKGLFNSRFAQFTRHGSHHEDNLYPIDFFPFNTVEQSDPVTGERGDGLSMARESDYLPKIFFINSSTDYWTRAASLLHTDVEGNKDSEIDPNVRMYAMAGMIHSDGRIGVIGRALLVAMDQWVSSGIEPPASRIPRISDGTLVDLESWREAFPDIPGVLMPPSFYHPYRLDMGPRWNTEGIADNAPPIAGPRYVCLVPQVDEDGNEIAGVHLPEIAAPLSTCTGWSMRSPFYSLTLRRNSGRIWPFPVTAEERERNGDPRRSIFERYPSKADYLFQVTKSLLHLNRQRFLLDEDLTMLLMEAAQQTYWPPEEGGAGLAIKEIIAQPAVVGPGETILLSVEFEGLQNRILLVRASIREANNMSFMLNDDGSNGDRAAGDNIWSYAVEIPADAIPGEFHFDLKCLSTGLDDICAVKAGKDGMGDQCSLLFKVR